MVALVYDLFGSGASVGDALGARRSGSSDKECPTAREVDSASSEVVRARDATHSAIALRTAPTGGRSEARMSGKEAASVEQGMGGESVKNSNAVSGQ